MWRCWQLLCYCRQTMFAVSMANGCMDGKIDGGRVKWNIMTTKYWYKIPKWQGKLTSLIDLFGRIEKFLEPRGA